LPFGRHCKTWQTRFTDVHPAIEDLVNRYPAVPAYRAALAVNHNLDGRNNAAAGKTAVAEAHFRQSVQLNSVLLRYDPSTSHWENYARAGTLWSQMLMVQGRRNDAAEAKEETIRVYEETLKTGNFGSQQWRMLELQLDSLVSLLDAMGRGGEALIYQLRAEEIRDEWGFVPLNQLRPELEN